MADNHLEKFHQEQIEKQKKAAEIYSATIHALKNEERFVEFFKSYNAATLEGFYSYYAQMKASWHTHADDFYKYRIQNLNKWEDECKEHLMNIFYKKLFDLKCRWYAGEMDLPEINCSADFIKFANNPMDCPHIEPISEAEFQCYLAFVNEYGLDFEEIDDEDFHSPQISFSHQIEGRNNAFEEEDVTQVSHWFLWYDKHFGTGHLKDMHMVRWEMEQDYLDIYMVDIFPDTLTPEQRAAYDHKPLTRLQRDELRADPAKREAYYAKNQELYAEREKNRPQYRHISIYDRSVMAEVMQHIENRDSINRYKWHREWKDRNAREEEVEYTIDRLQEVNEYVPVESAPRWQDALKKAHTDYEAKIIIQTLPFVYDKYKEAAAQKTNYGISGGGHGNPEHAKRILAARKHKGEPENFEFLKKQNLPKP